MKKTLCILLVIANLILGVFMLAACDSSEPVISTGEYIHDVDMIATAPKGLKDLLEDDDAVNTLSKAFDDTFDEDQKQEAVKEAVLLLYKTANKSRIDSETNGGVSLMVQRSLGGSEQGRVYMNGFTLQNGNSWYYQLPAQAVTGDTEGYEDMAALLSFMAGNLQIAYTTEDGGYDYFYIMGDKPQLDCSLEVFPYATYVIPSTEKPTHYDTFEAYQADRNCRDSQLELNNIGVVECAELMTNCTIEHLDGYYRVTFEMDCENATKAQMDEFQRFSKLDLDIGLPIDNTILKWRAELEVWENGYAKTFRSYEEWDMKVMTIFSVESTPSNEFVYVWNEDEILSVVCQDSAVAERVNANPFDSDREKIQTCIDYYAKKAQNESTFVFNFYTLVLVLVCCVVGAIIIVSIVLSVLFKKGKLPKLAAAIERDKERRKAISEQNKADRARKKEIKQEKKDACQDIKDGKVQEDAQECIDVKDTFHNDVQNCDTQDTSNID